MKQIKAYMSGPASQRADRVVLEYRERLAAKRPEAAEREARAILAETEPTTLAPRCLGNHPASRIPVPFAQTLRTKTIRHWTPRQDVRWEANQALATSLAAFVALEIS